MHQTHVASVIIPPFQERTVGFQKAIVTIILHRIETCPTYTPGFKCRSPTTETGRDDVICVTLLAVLSIRVAAFLVDLEKPYGFSRSTKNAATRRESYSLKYKLNAVDYADFEVF